MTLYCLPVAPVGARSTVSSFVRLQVADVRRVKAEVCGGERERERILPVALPGGALYCPILGFKENIQIEFM